MRILTWNLFHGRSLPAGGGRELAEAFSRLLVSWDWEVALLQEVPPWWPPRLAREALGEQRTVLTSRNALAPLRRGIAERWPELTRSNGGGSNAVLVRGQPIHEHRRLTLRRWPERRVAQLLRLGEGTCVANFHASARVRLAEEELERLWSAALAWAGERPLVVGGDLNLRSPGAPRGTAHVGARDVDHLFARGFATASPALVLDRRVSVGRYEVELSDHPPLLAHLELPAGISGTAAAS